MGLAVISLLSPLLPFSDVCMLVFLLYPKHLSLLRAAESGTDGQSVCLIIAAFPPSFCFTWEEIGEEIINTMCCKSLIIQTCESTLNAKIATTIILLI